MKITICSREQLLKDKGNKRNIISFYEDLDEKFIGRENDNIIYCNVQDIDYSELSDYDLTFEEFFIEAKKVAQFVLDCINQGKDIICQCEYGQGRSAGCAAAIRQHMNSDGIEIFSDYRYYPNKMVYNKLLQELKNIDG